MARIKIKVEIKNKEQPKVDVVKITGDKKAAAISTHQMARRKIVK
ncbi:MAG: hypothetical protein AAF652_14190 [Cyanobacteria bacterium P01_C01_bin.72]